MSDDQPAPESGSDQSAAGGSGLSITPTGAAESNPAFAAQASGMTPKAPAQVHTESVIPENTPADQGTARSYADKFNSVEDLESAYKSLETKLGERSQFGQMNVDQLIDAIGLDMNQITANWKADRKLTPEQYEAFARAGWSESIVNGYLSGQEAVAQNGVYAQQKMLQHAHDLCGGELEFDGLKRWAAMNVPEERLDALNKRLADPAHYESALKELLWDWNLATGKGGQGNAGLAMLSGQAMPNTTAGFPSSHEMLAEMQRVKDQGYMDAGFKARMANTAPSIVQGIDK